MPSLRGTKEAVKLLKEVLSRLEKQNGNANGGTAQVGGMYWRLAKLMQFVDRHLDDQEGHGHASFIRNNHGVLVPIVRQESLMNAEEVCERVGFRGRSSLYAAMKAGSFPRPVKRGGRSVAWPVSVIDNWIKERIADSTGA